MERTLPYRFSLLSACDGLERELSGNPSSRPTIVVSVQSDILENQCVNPQEVPQMAGTGRVSQ
jgi:hypothetical protein